MILIHRYSHEFREVQISFQCHLLCPLALLLPLHLAVSPLPPLHETFVRRLRTDLVASEVEADVAAGEALGAVLGRALAALGGAVAVAKLALLPQDAPFNIAHVKHDRNLSLKVSSCSNRISYLEAVEKFRTGLLIWSWNTVRWNQIKSFATVKGSYTKAQFLVQSQQNVVLDQRDHHVSSDETSKHVR